VTSDVAEALGLTKARGALVSKVLPGSPAEKAGMNAGEVVTAVNGVSVEHPDALGYRLTTVGIGGTARITVVSNSKTQDLTLSLDRAPETTPRDERLIEGRNPFSGAVVANLSPRVAEELRMPAGQGTTNGVVVTEVNRGSPAARIGLQPRDIIIELNGTAVTTTETLAKLAGEDPSIWRVEIERDGQRIRQFFR
jgi:S1-C subfamily serine protease